MENSESCGSNHSSGNVKVVLVVVSVSIFSRWLSSAHPRATLLRDSPSCSAKSRWLIVIWQVRCWMATDTRRKSIRRPEFGNFSAASSIATIKSAYVKAILSLWRALAGVCL